MTFQPGDRIVERGVWFNTVFNARPMTVVADTPELLATYLCVGTHWFGARVANRQRAFDELSEGTVTWGERIWKQHNVLLLARPGDAYSVQAFWDEQGKFVAWYVNLQDPIRRTPFGYDTRDHILDVIVGEDLMSWMWKDEHELDASVTLGLLTSDEAAGARRAGEAVIELVEAGQTWWGEWRDWTPDPSWPIPTLPEGWDRV